MVNIPSASTKTVFCARATISDGTDTYLSAKNLRFRYSYAILQETVIGSHDPTVATGEFRGTIEFEFLACTDSAFHEKICKSSRARNTTITP